MENDRHLRLKLLRSLPPLIDSTLPSPPPSPSTSNSSSKLNVNSSTTTGSSSTKGSHVDDKQTSGNGSSSSMMSRVSQGGGSSSTGKAEDWRILYPKERLKKIATLYREKGRESKHAGDRTARSEGSSTILSILQQTEAILFYIYSFWCDDQANGRVCLAQNWQSIFGLITFVKKAAETVGDLRIIVGICLRMEAYTVQTLSNHEQKTLSYQASKLLPSSSSTSSTTAPPVVADASLPTDSNSLSTSTSSSTATSSALIQSPSLPIPPIPKSSSSTKLPPTSLEILKQYHKASVEIFRYQRLFDDSSLYLTPTNLNIYLPPSPSSSSFNKVEAFQIIDQEGPALISKSTEFRTRFDLGRIGLLDRTWGNFSSGLEIVRSVSATRELILGVARVKGIVEFVEGVVPEV